MDQTKQSCNSSAGRVADQLKRPIFFFLLMWPFSLSCQLGLAGKVFPPFPNEENMKKHDLPHLSHFFFPSRILRTGSLCAQFQIHRSFFMIVNCPSPWPITMRAVPPIGCDAFEARGCLQSPEVPKYKRSSKSSHVISDWRKWHLEEDLQLVLFEEWKDLVGWKKLHCKRKRVIVFPFWIILLPYCVLLPIKIFFWGGRAPPKTPRC